LPSFFPSGLGNLTNIHLALFSITISLHKRIRCSENKKLLRFHGVDPDTIEEKYGVTSGELSYLLQLFNAGSISRILDNEKSTKPFEKDSYWYDILENKSTQDAFPLLRELFNSKNIFMMKCEETIRLIKKTED
tara:strand:+ start:3952 stop:4353 length:402 start_codon:yes stop_codon:yes gene_type:complete